MIAGVMVRISRRFEACRALEMRTYLRSPVGASWGKMYLESWTGVIVSPVPGDL